MRHSSFFCLFQIEKKRQEIKRQKFAIFKFISSLSLHRRLFTWITSAVIIYTQFIDSSRFTRDLLVSWHLSSRSCILVCLWKWWWVWKCCNLNSKNQCRFTSSRFFYEAPLGDENRKKLSFVLWLKELLEQTNCLHYYWMNQVMSVKNSQNFFDL